ncbi:hypothetical protein OMP38_20365 [Cohnella ginsengisoli]|uniref:Hydrolase n=1 Tax=Cohnella ginsengisoli TaxID=425004 RepID=A0A9X4KJL1_9BACL|nr:hypothetical protein [Cohnella ginsengisoli]MDG0792961.1 hypothetical protein [Cohnella ginsengisoli]
MDFYLEDEHVVSRLVAEWRKYGRLVVAYDYDNTVFDYHRAGLSFDDVPRLLRECQAQGAYLVVFTACGERQYPEIASYLKDNGIPFDAINEDAPFVPSSGGRKIYFNILLDDRAGLGSAYRCLQAALNIMKRGA